MKRLGLLLVVILSLVFTLGANAAATKIAYVNWQKALNESIAGKDAKADLADEIKRRQDDVNAKQEELKKLKEELEKKGAVLSKEVREQKEIELNRKSVEFQRSFIQSEEALKKKEQDSIKDIITEMEDIVRKIAKEKGYDFVFEKREAGIILGPVELDLTDEVIKVHNKQYKKVKK